MPRSNETCEKNFTIRRRRLMRSGSVFWRPRRDEFNFNVAWSLESIWLTVTPYVGGLAGLFIEANCVSPASGVRRRVRRFLGRSREFCQRGPTSASRILSPNLQQFCYSFFVCQQIYVKKSMLRKWITALVVFLVSALILRIKTCLTRRKSAGFRIFVGPV